ncbi:hypothetical protein WAX74_09470 [Psychrobacillus sp. FJAT-51614]|uniref:Uncharacterized protein n=1 Tax=Psychrobacillus mangrovi TaxID=3117745 RepID=A0ABU8F6J1_9BACI
MIKNIGLITDELKNFSFADLKCISNFNLSFQKVSNVHSSLLDVDFIIEGNGTGYLVQFRFYNPQSISFESDGLFHEISLNIKDIAERGWEKIKYEVEDYEENTLHFFCSEIEILSISETNYLI